MGLITLAFFALCVVAAYAAWLADQIVRPALVLAVTDVLCLNSDCEETRPSTEGSSAYEISEK